MILTQLVIHIYFLLLLELVVLIFIIFLFQLRSDIFSAIRSVSKNDDEALIQEVFSGDNNFVLSNEDDVIDGFAGDDNFETGLGNDVIDGGSGTDRVKLSGNYSDYQITHNALENKFTITGSNETKTVTNVEQFDFDDVSYLALN